MRPTKLWIILSALALVLVIALGAWWLRHRGTSDIASSSVDKQPPVAPADSGAKPSPVPSSPPATPEPQVSGPDKTAGALPGKIGKTVSPAAGAQGNTVADVLEEIGDLNVPGNRERALARIKVIEQQRRAEAQERARRLGLPIRIERPDGTVQELAGFDGDQPVYFTTNNSNAAISTGVSILRNAPYSLDGSGVVIGLWDGGSARSTHQEFATGSRVTVKDGASSIDHATHVCGTLAAAGLVSNARGMATAATVDSYDWNSDVTEMTARAAAAPNDPGMLYLSNHSYNYISGWNYVNGGAPQRVWEWWGNGTTTTGYEQDFGRYNTYTRDSDALAYSAPYYLMFRSAGNERTDNPANGETVSLSPGGGTVVTYSSASHPAGDGAYRGGFECIGFDALAKNVFTVGSAADAVTSGARDPSKANVSSFSSWGPTDDGRIKPDAVANGESLYSSLNQNNFAYGTYSGTSMSTPNTTGTAALLIQEYQRSFPGGAMRSSTLKGLLLHTADDRGNPGPDYKYGWGLINGVAAADLIRDQSANPGKLRLSEGLITSTNTTINHDFVWDGVSPIRATLCWTDPAGTATTTTDLRTARLRNNLDLKIVGPGGAQFQPYIMPFVGTWTVASMDLPATTGKNNVDNVEQVYLASPPAAGVYTCVITFDGTLANNQQYYSLLVTGSAAEPPPPQPLTITQVTPANALPGAVTINLAGTGFQAGTAVKLQRSGSSDINATSVQFSGGALTCQFNLAGAAPGLWDVTATNPDSETFTLPAAFTVLDALWSETFDGTVTGWSSQSTTGTNAWVLTTAQSHSPPTSYFAPGPSSKTTCNLTSPVIPIPANATDLQFKFWHNYNLQNTRDAGKLEFSVDGGSTWFDVIASGSGASFASNGYNVTVNNTGSPSSRNEFAGQQAWSGNSGGFIETIVNLTDNAKYAGKNFRARWRIATNGSTSSVGWYVDSAALFGGADVVNQPPQITSPAVSSSLETFTDTDSTLYYIVRGQETDLSVAATDDGGEPALTYTWSSTQTGSTPASFTASGNNAAKNTTALFEETGDYLITVTVRDAQSLAATSSVNVRVLQTATDVSVSPASASVTVGAQQTYSAMLLDQFGVAMASQPPSFTWDVSGGGGISGAGVFTATTAGGPYVITAASGALSGIASVTVNPAQATVMLSNMLQTFDGNPKPVTVTTVPPNLSHSVTYNGGPAAPTAVGSYAVVATITDPNYQGSAAGTLVIQPRQFTLTVSASPVEGGNVTGEGTFDEGTLTSITATAAEGWNFGGWSGVGITEPQSPSTTVTVDADKTVIATFIPIPPYDLWAAENNLMGDDADKLADPDGDGLCNLIEFGLGTDPNSPTQLPQVQIEPDTALAPADRLTMRFSRPVDHPGVSYHVWVSSDLEDWEEVTDITVEPDLGGETETVIARDSQVVSTTPRFMRLEVRDEP